MQLFALQTDREKTKRDLLSQNEELILTVNYSRFIYLLGIIPQLCAMLLLIGIGVLFSQYRVVPVQWIIVSGIVIWALFVFVPVLYRYIHWYYSFVLVTRERIVIVDQVSVVHKEVTEVSLENFARVAAETQFWNIFPFGILHFTMREENGEPVALHYVPDVENSAKKIADVVTTFQGKA